MSEEQGSVPAGNPENVVSNEPALAPDTGAGISDGWANAQYDEVVAAKGWSSPDDVLQSYQDLERSYHQNIGVDKVALPEEGSNFQEWEGWSQIGWPEDASNYALAAPEGFSEQYDQGLSDDMRQVFHDARLTPDQATLIHDKYVERFSNNAAQTSQNAQHQQDQWLGELQDKYGTAYEERIAVAQGAVREFGNDNLVNLLNETGLGSHPDVVDAFVQAGMALAESGQFKEGDSGRFGMTPADAKAEIASIRGNPNLVDKSHPEYKVLNDRLTDLYEFAYPNDRNSNIVATVG